jgi:hypothetical protein
MIETNKYRAWILENWRLLVGSFVIVLLVGGILLFRLGSLNKGASLSETAYINSLRSGKNLLADPTYLIHKLPAYMLYKLGCHSVTFYRLVSVIFTASTVLSCFVLLKRAYTTRVATLGATLLLTSAWILHVGRAATPEVSFLLILPMLLVATWLHSTSRHYPSLLVLCMVFIVGLYIPGFWLLVLAVITWEYKAIFAALRSVTWWFRVICGFVLVLGLLPLAWAIAHDPSIVTLVVGLPKHVSDIRFVGSHFLNIPKNLFVYGPIDPARWLGRIPILDFFSSAMLVLGVYSLRYHFKRHDIQMLAGSTILLTALISAGGLITVTALIPLLYVFVGAGIAFMLRQWVTVFPRNPIARTLATSLMSITVLLVSYYHISHYFIAWPRTPATKQAFGHSLLK